MASDPGLTELRRGVLGPCVLAMLEVRPRFGLELVRDLGAAGGLLTSQWEAGDGQRPRRYYSITEAGRQGLAAFRDEWDQFSKTVGGVLHQRWTHLADPRGEGPE